MIEVKDLTVGSFQGAITLVYEDKETNSVVLDNLKAKKVFEGKAGEVFYKINDDLNYDIFVGLGKYEELERTDLINAVSRGIKQAEKLKIDNLSINFIKANGLCTGGVTKSIVQGVKLAGYKFNKYKQGKEGNYEPKVTIIGGPKEKLDKMRELEWKHDTPAKRIRKEKLHDLDKTRWLVEESNITKPPETMHDS